MGAGLANNLGRATLQNDGRENDFDHVESSLMGEDQASITEKWDKFMHGVSSQGAKYTDPDFPPDRTSLIEDWDSQSRSTQTAIEQWQHYKWVRCDQIPQLNVKENGSMSIFKESIEPSDIIQGKLEDSYYLSALAAIAETPSRIKSMFLSQDMNNEGVFGVKTYFNGMENLMVVDNLFPCKNSKPMFAKSNNNELWALILEKVWAKHHRSYQAITAGQSYEVFRDLLGAPSYYYKVNEKNVWKVLRLADKNKYICSVTAKPGEAEKKKLEALGSVSMPSYCLLQTVELLDRSNTKIKLMKLKNPWGTFEWNGDWSENSDLWTDKLKE